MIHHKQVNKIKYIVVLLAVLIGLGSIGLTEATAAGPDMTIIRPNDNIPTNYKVIQGSTIYDTKTLDMWHWSAGYWEVGNAGQAKIRISDNEFRDTDGQIAPADTATFNLLLPQSVRDKIAEGKTVAGRVNTTGGNSFDDLFASDSISSSLSGNQLIINMKPKFNVVPYDEMNFYRHFNLDVTHIPFIEPKYGCHLYSMVGNGLYEVEAKGWIDRNNKFSTSPPSGQITPAMVASATGALKSGFSIRTSQGNVQSGGLNIGGPNVFKTGGAVGLHFEFPLSVTFYVVEEEPVIVPGQVNAVLSLPGNAIVGETYEAKDISPALPSGKTLDYTKLEKKVSGSWTAVGGWNGSRLGSSTSLTADKEGTVEYRLTVMCKDGSSGTSEKSIDILAEEDIPSNATAELYLPAETYRGHSVIAEDRSTYDTGSEIYSAKRAYAEGIASNSFRIISGGNGSLSRLTSTTQRATFSSIGSYSIRLTASPKNGADDTDIKSINVLPTPAIKDYLGGKQKQNRKQVIDLKIATYPTSKLTSLYVEIERLSNGEKVKLTHKLGSGTNTLENSDGIKTRPIEILPSDEYFTNCRLEFLTKNTTSEEFKYTVYAKDDEGNTDTIAKTFYVDPDRPPEAALNIEGPFIRGANSNVAEVKTEDKTTTDGDQVERTWYYRSTKAGQTESQKGPWTKLTTSSAGYTDYSFGTGKEIGFSKTGVGLVEVKIFAKDLWTDETLEEYVTDADRLTDEAVKETEVVNIAPVVSLTPIKTKSAGITILTGGQAEYDLVKSKQAQLEIDLMQQGIDPHITVEKMAPAASSGSEAAFKTTEIKSPSGYEINWLWYENGGYIVDEEHFYRINATWLGDGSGDYPEGPYTIGCWDFDASGTNDIKWSYTFRDSTLGQTNNSWQLGRGGMGTSANDSPFFAQDDSGKYLYFVASGTGKTIILSKDTGALLTVLNMEVGENCFAEGNMIYTFKKDGIYQISATSGNATKIYNGNILDGKYRRIAGEIHFVLRNQGKDQIFRGLFNPQTATVKLQTLPTPTLPRGNVITDTCLGIDTDGKIITYSLIRQLDYAGDISSSSYYYAQYFVHDEKNRLLFSSTPYSSSSLSQFTPIPIYNAEGVCNYVGHTLDGRNRTTATIFNIHNNYSKEVTITGKNSSPSVASKIPFARELNGKVYICVGAEWVWVWQSGFGIYEERLNTFVFDPASDSAKGGKYYDEVGINLSTYERGLHSDSIAAMQTTYGTPGNAYNLNLVTKWHQSLEQILNRYVNKNLKGEKDISLLLVYDETNKASMYTQGLVTKLNNKAGSLNTKFAKIDRNDLSAEKLMETLGSAEAEGKNVLGISVAKGKTGSLAKEIDLQPNRTYYYEYELKSNKTEQEDAAKVTCLTERPPGASYTSVTYKTIKSQYENFENKDKLNTFFTLADAYVLDGVYKAATITGNTSSNRYRVDPSTSELEERKITFTIPAGKLGHLSFNFLLYSDTMGNGTSNWGQFEVKIDGKMWNNGRISHGSRNYSHPELLEPGQHTITFKLHDYGRNLSSKIWLEDLKVDILEPHSGTILINSQTDTKIPLADGYVKINGSFESLPKIASYGEVSNVDMAGPIGSDSYTVWTNEAPDRAAFNFIIPYKKAAIFTNIPVSSRPASDGDVTYKIQRFNKNYDYSQLSWTSCRELRYPQTVIHSIPYGEYVLNPGVLDWITYPGYGENHANNSTNGIKGISLSASSYRYAYADFLDFSSVITDKDNAHWADLDFFLTGSESNKKYFLQKDEGKGIKFSFNLPEGDYSIKNFKLYTIENGVKVYAENDSFADSAKLSLWTKKDIAAATVKETVPGGGEEDKGLIYKKGQLVSYGISYYDYEGDPSKKQYWKYTHTPFNDGAHPDAAVILNDKGETVNISGKVLNAPIQRFYIDGKYTVEHWQEDNTTRPAAPGGNPDYDKLSNVESVTFYVQGGGSAPWIKSIKTDPASVKEGNVFKARVEVDDGEKDTLQLTTEFYRDGKLIHTHRKTGITANAAGVYPAVVTTNVPGTALAGRYEIVCTVRDATGAGVDSYRFTVISEGKITGKVSHTDQWDKNRKRYNLALFKEEYNIRSSFPEYSLTKAPRKRGINVFWSGEKFMLSADVAGKPNKVSAGIIGISNYKTTLKDTGKKNAKGESIYQGELWDKAMVNRWGKSKPQEVGFVFTAEYGGGITKTFEEKVIMDSNTDYWLLHRVY